MYEIRFYRGNYRWRQKQANRDDCAAYVEHHFNASINQAANYTLVITDYLASETSKNWARTYAQFVSETFGTKVGGVQGLKVGGYGGRGTKSLKHTIMPAILLEPLFGSYPAHADIIKSDAGQDKLAKCLADSIRTTFPNGGLIGFSVGHKGKTSNPNDRGATLYGGGNEADYAEIVMEKAKVLLEMPVGKPTVVGFQKMKDIANKISGEIPILMRMLEELKQAVRDKEIEDAPF